MHYHSLLTTNYPGPIQWPEVCTEIACYDEQLAAFQKRWYPTELKGALSRLIAKYLVYQQSPISQVVDGIMAPYGCESQEYLEFEDRTEELQDAYATHRIPCYLLPDGRVVEQDDPVLRKRFMIRGSMVYERSSGKLKQPKRTHRAKKIKALPNYPVKKLYKTFDDYATNYACETFDEEHQAYGFYCNPNAMWDWYQIGGRWPVTFLVKDSCTDCDLGERSWGTEDVIYPVPGGYQWVSAARKKDIQWDVMKNWYRLQAEKRYNDLVATYVLGSRQPDPGEHVKDGVVYQFGGPIFQIGATLEEYIKSIGLGNDRKYCVTFEDIISESDWRSNYGFFPQCGPDSERTSTWDEETQAYIDSLDDETYMVSIDYHM